MLELLRLELRRLTNDEALTYTSEFYGTVHSFPTVEKSLEKVTIPFKNAISFAATTSTKVDISKLTLIRNDKNSVRASCYLFFRGVISSATQSPDEAEKQIALDLVRILKLHDWKMQALPPDKFTAKLKAIFNAFEDPTCKSGLAAIGADRALAKLLLAHQGYEVAEKACTDAKAGLQEQSTSKALKAVAEEYSKIINAIEGLILTSDDPQVVVMVERLNVVTEAKRQTIKAKATRAENAKKEAEAKGVDKPAENKPITKLAKKGVQMLESSPEPVEEAAANQLVGQQLLADNSVEEQSESVHNPVNQKSLEEDSKAV